MTGYRSKQRYTTATVYVDLATGLGYVHLQKSTSAKETVESGGVSIHADNGVFKANLWLEHARYRIKPSGLLD
jgi:hypothetical protein